MKKNPLYVVTNDGNVVEQAEGFMDAVIKKLGLQPAIELFNSLVGLLSDQVGNYGFFLYLQEIIDKFASFVEGVVETAYQFIPSR
ncbi:MAG: hypothetical protein CME69_06655 [Halobacteriovorax sp.]|nr:hypothetical protein [Halobacteriovorax sp.]